MQKVLFLTFTVFTTSIFSFAQQPLKSGLVMDEEEYESLSFTSEHIRIGSGARALKDKVDLSPYCPEIRHQGDISSCVGWSVGYGAMTIERAIKNNWKDRRQISENANSALFVYNQISTGNCDLGITMPKALNLIQEKGNCLASDFDFDINDCNKEVTPGLLQKAEKYRIEDYLPLFRISTDSEEKIKKVKLVLAQNKPVIVGMTVLNNFYQIKAGDQSWLPTVGDKTYAGGHAMVVVGYDDNKFSSPLRPVAAEMKGAFKIMNSWGKNWGENGFIWIRYAHFAKHCRQAFALMLTDADPITFDADKITNTQQPTPLEKKRKVNSEKTQSRPLTKFSGYFGFQHYIGWDNGPMFEEAKVQFSNEHYQLKGSWQKGDKFQLLVKNGFQNSYIYVFSIDAIGKTQVHFPRSEDYNDQFTGQKQSALIWENGSVLTIPTEDSALELTHKGDDHLVVLFSKNKIKAEYIKLLAAELAKAKANMSGRLFEILGKYMVPSSDITYQPNEMAFEVSTRSTGKIVPIILTVNVN